LTAGSGKITFATGANATLEVDNAIFAANSIAGFGAGDKVDFDAVGYASTDTVAYASGIVKIDNSTGATVASFDVTGTYTAANFTLSFDPSGPLAATLSSATSLRIARRPSTSRRRPQPPAFPSCRPGL
jgi:hypothetical protein